MPFARSRNAALELKIESVEGVFQAPSNTTDGLLVENPKITFSPQNVQTNEVAGSLDGRGPIPGGTQCGISGTVYLKGSGTPGTPGEISELLRICGWFETATQSVKSGITFSWNGAGVLSDSASGLASLTIGTALFVSSPGNPYVVGIVSASAAGAITLTNPDGSALVTTTESAGGTFTIISGVAGTAATAGSTISATLGAPFGTTLQQYRGMPMLLSTNPVVAVDAFVNDYTVGRIATFTDLFGSALSATTKASLRANVMYQPGSGTIPSASAMFYVDGKVWSLAGCRGDIDFTFDAAGVCKADFRLQGMFQAVADAAVPTVTYDQTRPPTFRGSPMLVDRKATALGSIMIKTGNQLVWPDDPNQAEGFSPPQIVSRNMSGSMDPYMTSEATRSLLTMMRNGDQHIIHARVQGSNGQKYGDKVAMTVPLGIITGYDPDPADGLTKENVDFFPYGTDAGAMLCFY